MLFKEIKLTNRIFSHQTLPLSTSKQAYKSISDYTFISSGAYKYSGSETIKFTEFKIK